MFKWVLMMGLLFGLFCVAAYADGTPSSPSLTDCQLVCGPGPGYVRLVKVHSPAGEAMVCLCHDEVKMTDESPADPSVVAQDERAKTKTN